MAKKIDIKKAFGIISICKRKVEIRQLGIIFASFIEEAQHESPMFARAKEELGEVEYNRLMNTLMFAVCSKCMQSSMPKREYEEYSKQITIEVEEKCDPSKAN